MDDGRRALGSRSGEARVWTLGFHVSDRNCKEKLARLKKNPNETKLNKTKESETKLSKINRNQIVLYVFVSSRQRIRKRLTASTESARCDPGNPTKQNCPM